MSQVWRLNGVKLIDSIIQVKATNAKYNRSVKQDTQTIRGATTRTINKGLELPSFSIEFVFLGLNEQRFTELREVIDVLESDDVWTLEAPSNVKIYRDESRAAFSTTRLTTDIPKGRGKMTLRVQAVLNGVWIGDGGDYCESISGYFERSGANYTLNSPIHLPDQDGDVDTTPLVKLPEQTSGYPLAIRSSDFAQATPTLDSTSTDTVDGFTVIFEHYDLTGFLLPSDPASGETGVFELCSSPTGAFIGGGISPLLPLGIGGNMVGGFQVGAS